MKKGDLFIATTGEYSDYCIRGTFKVLKDFSLNEIGELYFSKNPEQKGSYNFENEKFIAFIIKDGYVEEFDIKELYLGDYSTMNLELI